MEDQYYDECVYLADDELYDSDDEDYEEDEGERVIQEDRAYGLRSGLL
jgi:hypothetical protein